MSEFLNCVVCGTAVPSAAEVCPTCAEPRVRVCVCAIVVTLDQHTCPNCRRIVPRVVGMAERAKRRRRVHIALGVIATIGVAGAALVIWPFARDSRSATALRNEAFAAAATSDTEAAVRALTEYLRLRPGDAEAHALLARAHFALGETDAGLAEARRALASNPNLPGLQLVVANQLMARGETLAALSEARAAQGPGAASVVAEALARLGHRVEAAAAFDAAMTENSDDVSVCADAAAVHALLAAADWPGAAEHRRRTIDLCDAVARNAAPLLGTRGPAAIAAARAAARALAVRPSPDLDTIETSAAALVRAAPDDPRVRIDVARALLAAGHTAAAIDALGGPPTGATSTELRVDRARTLRDCGRESQALDELSSVLQTDPGNVGAAVAVARIRLDANRPLDAMGAISAARSAGAADTPDSLEAAADAAIASDDSRDVQRRLEEWQAAAPIDPRPRRRMLDSAMPAALQRRRARFNADAATRTALEQMDALAALDPDDRSLLYWRTQWDALTGHDNEATARFARLFAIYPDDPAVRELRIVRAFTGLGNERPESIAASAAADPQRTDVNTLMREALRHGQWSVALDAAAAVLSQHPDDATALEYLAHALVESGRPAAAMAAIDAAPSAVGAVRSLADLRLTAAALSGNAPSMEELAPAGADLDRLLDAARAMAIAGRAAEAEAALRRARLAAGEVPDSLAKVAACLEDADRFDDAAEVWDAAVLTSPGDASLQVRSGLARLARGASSTPENRSAAAARLVAVSARRDGAATAIALRGAFAIASGNADSGMDDARQVLAADPDRAHLHLLLARALLDSQRLAEAAAEARIVRRLRPTSIPGRCILSLALTRLATTSAEAGELLSTLAALEEVSSLAAGPDSAGGPALGLRRAALTSEALALCAAESREPGGTGSRLVLALCAAAGAAPAPDGADALATAVVESRPDIAGGWVVRAFLRGLAGRAEDSSADIATADEMSAPEPDTAFVRAAALARSGDVTRAASVLDRWTARQAPPRIRAAAAEIALRVAGTREKALAAFADLLAKSPTEADAIGLHPWGAALAELAANDAPGSARVLIARRVLVQPPRAPRSPSCADRPPRQPARHGRPRLAGVAGVGQDVQRERP
ncbi:MAG: tetratricopeptide repeat protein [Planctomycetes bacterium]|nr:tetratricopeptide repeat protein [Planctomycetota bacterium]